MTREEAIYGLEDYATFIADGTDLKEAITMAIDALKATEINLNQTDFDCLCICALRYCQGRTSYMPSVIHDIIAKNLSKLSKTTLEVMLRDQSDMKTCAECYDKHQWENFYELLYLYLSDVNIEDKYIRNGDECFDVNKRESLDTADEAPKVQNRPKSKWVLSRTQYIEDLDLGICRYECSNCGYADSHAESAEVPLCPNCGADMRGGKKE